MAVIAVYSVKGGVGKTTIATNLAWCSASISRRRTLLWDLDPAGGSAFLLGMAPPKKRRAASIFTKSFDPAQLVKSTGFSNLDLLPADESLRSLDSQLAALGKRKRLGKLAEALSRDYDRIVLDCPPVLNEVSSQVIRAADVIIVPLPASPLALRALDTIWAELAAHHKKPPPILPVLSMFDGRRKVHKEAREQAPRWPIIPMASIVEQMAVRQAPLGSFAPTSPASQAFARLWTAIEQKLAKAGK